MSLLRRTAAPPSTDAQNLAVTIAYTRVGIGAAMLLAPRLVWRPLAPAEKTLDISPTPLRMAAARDLALGAGAVLAAKRSAGALRGWTEAGVLADSVDAVLLVTDRRLRLLPRLAVAVLAAAAAVYGRQAASQLT
jgi:hypothetical protein